MTTHSATHEMNTPPRCIVGATLAVALPTVTLPTVALPHNALPAVSRLATHTLNSFALPAVSRLATHALPTVALSAVSRLATHALNSFALPAALRTTFLLTIVLLTLLFPFASISAHANSAGRISGYLLDGTHKNTPVIGQNVTLQMAAGNTAKDLASITTDTHGGFSFANLSTDQSLSYAIYTRYQGAQYTSSLISLSTKAVQQLNLIVYDATTSAAKVAILQAAILLHEPDAQNSLFTVSELFTLRNLDTHTYVGSLDASHGLFAGKGSKKPNALRFSLPHAARNIALGRGFEGYTAIQVDQGFATDAALPPGDSQFAFTFDVPYAAPGYAFDYLAIYPIVQLLLYVPPDVRVSTSSLSAQGVITADLQLYQLFKTTGIVTRTEMHVQLAGLPTTSPVVNTVPTALDVGAGATRWLILALLFMAIVLLVTWTLYRSKRHSLSSKPSHTQLHGQQNKDTKTRTKLAIPLALGQGEKKDQQQALLQALLELDTTYEAGKMTKAVYQDRRTNIKAQLRTLMSEKEAS